MNPGLSTIALVCLFSLLSGCGGGGGSNSNSSAPIAGTPTPTPEPTPAPQFCGNGQAITTIPGIPSSETPVTGNFSVSGTVTPAEFTDIDGDTGDPFSPRVDNNSPEQAQSLNNPVVAAGFVRGFSRFDDTDRDDEDWFCLTLAENQVVTVAEINDDVGQDLDLFLYSSEDTDNPVSSSITDNSIESVIAPSAGGYFIRVVAAAGANQYLLETNTTGIASAPGQDFYPGEVVIQWNSDDESQIQASAMTASFGPVAEAPKNQIKRYRIDQLGGEVNLQMADSINQMLDRLHSNLSQQMRAKLVTLYQIKALHQMDSVAFAEPDFRVQAHRLPTDEFIDLQWHYNNIRLPQAWDLTIGGSSPATGPVVAVIDTGIFPNHPDLSGQFIDGFDFINNIDGGIDPGDQTLPGGNSSWHGTHVSGTVGATTDNNTGVAGVGWNVRVMPLRALGNNGGRSSDVANAIRYAARVANGSGQLPSAPAAVINMSLGALGNCPFSFQSAIDDAIAAGVVVVASAGNENTSLENTPANCDGVIAVAATDFANERAPYSNFGSWVDIAAPGGDQTQDLNGDGFGDGVLSTFVDESGSAPTPAIGFLQGTSMSSPHVSGVLALMRAADTGPASAFPTLVNDCLASGEMTDNLADNNLGQGLLNALKSVNCANSGLSGVVITSTPSALAYGSTAAALNINLERLGSDPTSLNGSASATEPWVSGIIPVNVDEATGLGEYRIEIDRSDLVDGTYTALVQFPFTNTNTFALPISMRVGSSETAGTTGQIYAVIVKNSDTNGDGFLDNVDQVVPDFEDGQYTYTFPNVPPDDDYLIFAGTDINDDGFICDPGEACGVYPIDDFNFVDEDGDGLQDSGFSVSEDETNFNFVTNYFNNFSTSTNSNSNSEDTHSNSARLRVKLMWKIENKVGSNKKVNQ